MAGGAVLGLGMPPCPLTPPPCPQPLLFAELLEENRLVLVERPLADIRAQLPPPVQQQPFGT